MFCGLASYLNSQERPSSKFLIFQGMRALVIGNVTQMLWLLAKHLNEQLLGGFMFTTETRTLQIQHQFCVWRFDQFLEIQDILRLLDPHDFLCESSPKMRWNAFCYVWDTFFTSPSSTIWIPQKPTIPNLIVWSTNGASVNRRLIQVGLGLNPRNDLDVQCNGGESYTVSS